VTSALEIGAADRTMFHDRQHTPADRSLRLPLRNHAQSCGLLTQPRRVAPSLNGQRASCCRRTTDDEEPALPAPSDQLNFCQINSDALNCIAQACSTDILRLSSLASLSGACHSTHVACLRVSRQLAEVRTRVWRLTHRSISSSISSDM
jgi:hypothetical protein